MDQTHDKPSNGSVITHLNDAYMRHRRQYFKGRVAKSNKVEWYFLLFFAGHNHSKVCKLIHTAYILMYITHRVYILFDIISFYAVLCYSCPMTIWYIGWHDTLYFDVRLLPCKNITSLRNCCDFLCTKPEIKNRIALRREKIFLNWHH